MTNKDIERIFLSSFIGAIVTKQEEIVRKVTDKIKPEYFQGSLYRALYQKLRSIKTVEEIFLSLNGDTNLFYDLLNESNNFPPIILYKVAKDITANWRERKIRQLQKQFATCKYPEDRDNIYRKIKEIENIDPFEEENYSIKERILNKTIKEEDFGQEMNWLYENLILPGTLNIVFGQPSAGKSLFVLALAIHLIKNNIVQDIYYLDGDNPTIVLKKRGLTLLIKKYPQLHYFKPKSSKEMRSLLRDISNLKENSLIIIDSLKDLAGADYSLDKSKEAAAIQKLLQYVRDGGESGYEKTVIVLHHINKVNGSNILFRAKNSTIFVDGADAAYYLQKLNFELDKVYIKLTPAKHRVSNKEIKFEISVDARSFREVDFVLTRSEQEIINAAKQILIEHEEPVKQDWLIRRLKELGFPQKKCFYTLRKYGERFFTITKNNFPKIILYSLKKDEVADFCNCPLEASKGGIHANHVREDGRNGKGSGGAYSVIQSNSGALRGCNSGPPGGSSPGTEISVTFRTRRHTGIPEGDRRAHKIPDEGPARGLSGCTERPEGGR